MYVWCVVGSTYVGHPGLPTVRGVVLVVVSSVGGVWVEGGIPGPADSAWPNWPHFTLLTPSEYTWVKIISVVS